MKRRLLLNKRPSSGGGSLLLDLYPSASGAYSLRYLSSSYSGAVVRVRRDNDNVEQDFTPLQITDGTLLTFTGANNGYVTTLYDQSGNANDVIPQDSNNEDIIVNLGVLNTNNGLPSILSAGVRWMETTTSFNSNIFSFISIALNNTTVNTSRPVGINSGLSTATSFFHASDNSLRFDGGSQLGTISASTSNKIKFSGRNGNEVYDYINNVQNINTTKVLPNSTGVLNIIRVFNGNWQEGVFWNLDQTSNRTAIQDNLNAYYSIY